MILKFRTARNRWKYEPGIESPEVESMEEGELLVRLFDDGSQNMPMPSIGAMPTSTNNLVLLALYRLVPVIDLKGVYPGVHIPIAYEKASGEKPTYKESENRQMMLAITCFNKNGACNYFTNCETYLLNDKGQTINRLL